MSETDSHSQLQRPLRREARAAGAARAGQTHSRLVARAVVRAREGDRDALGFLYARYAEDVYACVLDVAHDRELAARATDRVFVGLPGAIASYEEREVSFAAWLLTVARGVAEEHARLARAVAAEEAGRIARPRGAGTADHQPAGGERSSAGSRRAMRWLSRSAR
jgi:Sigma-70 region 2